jgi:oligoendopeptidase F
VEEELLTILWAYENLDREVSRLFSFASLNFSADSQNQTTQNYLAQFRQIVADAVNRTIFFKLWWKQLEDKPAQLLMKNAGPFSHWLNILRQERPYALTEAEERIINLKDVNGSQALLTLMSTITDRYEFILEVEGEEKKLTEEELRAYFYDPEADLREAAYQEYLRVYRQDKIVLGQIYQYRVRDWYSEQINLRKYDSPIAVRNLANDLPNEVVDILLEVCRHNRSLFQRYFELKARWLGKDRLSRYDVLAPVVEIDSKYTFQEAVELVLSSFTRFNPEVGELAERVFSEHHIDSEVRAGKRGGAFCSTVTPDLTPWILQSFRGKPQDVATMAHELGHAVHSMLAAHHPALTQHASLPLAETASTFGEMIIVDRLLSEDPDPQIQLDLQFKNMDRHYSTIMRQAYFAIFEREAHDSTKQGASIDDLSVLYGQNLSELFGDSVEIAEEFHLEWISIPHFYRYPFYVYAYAFGKLLVLSLYQQYLTESSAFIPRFLKILSAGGSDSPANILGKAGIDFSSTEFWQGGFDVIEETLVQLEELEPPSKGSEN